MHYKVSHDAKRDKFQCRNLLTEVSLKVPVCVVGCCTHVVLTFVNGSLLDAVTSEESSCQAEREIDTRKERS